MCCLNIYKPNLGKDNSSEVLVLTRVLGKLAGYVLSLGECCFTAFLLPLGSGIHRDEFQICLNIVSIAFLVEMV